MHALALVIGNAKYSLEKYVLDNSSNDAADFGAKLESLKFDVIKVKDCNIGNFDIALKEFQERLKGYQVGLFFYSGHALQIEGRNYLTAVDTGFQDEFTVKRTSIGLHEVIDRIETVNPTIKIIILDACRDNPFSNQFRGISIDGLAPVYAPKGSIIAFSTSPGQKAMDSGAGRNSIYTGALLNHISDRNIPIEEFFKRVRTTVYSLTNGRQTSWEHTSMIGNFSFNSGQMIHSVSLPYRPDYVSDSEFTSEGREIDNIILDLREKRWDSQNSAIEKLNSFRNKGALDSNIKFLIGRNILQAAEGNAFRATELLESMHSWLANYSDADQNHVLNGILYEIYFDSSAEFRKERINIRFLDKIFELQSDVRFSESFKFIKDQLSPYTDYLFWIPGTSNATVPIEVILEKKEERDWEDELVSKFKVVAIRSDNSDLLHSFYRGRRCDYAEFCARLSEALFIPNKLLRVSVNLTEAKKSDYIIIPNPFMLSRFPPDESEELGW